MPQTSNNTIGLEHPLSQAFVRMGGGLEAVRHAVGTVNCTCDSDASWARLMAHQINRISHSLSQIQAIRVGCMRTGRARGGDDWLWLEIMIRGVGTTFHRDNAI